MNIAREEYDFSRGEPSKFHTPDAKKNFAHSSEHTSAELFCGQGQRGGTQYDFDRCASLLWFEPLNPEGALLTALSQTI
ncbi:MAG: hypothetical protein CME36_15075 [unclassified Hahellaceae]|nr:hypothetical protein [Hahellaceae bacterium]|tara:strand:+ start:170 stop:406 length:237 start_codon:yes stop_codon:yes gene_type:complete